MTLRLQFDDIMNRVSDIASVVGGEEEFIEMVTEVINISDKGKLLEEERKTLEKIIAKREKQLARKRAEFKRLSAELEKEKKKIEVAKKENRVVEKTLENVRRAVMRNDGNTTNAEILSLIESASSSDASEEWDTAMNE